MPSLRDELAADLADAVGDYEQTFRWKGAGIPCVRTTEAAALYAAAGGQEEDVDERIVVVLTDLPTGPAKPRQGDLVDGCRLQIKRVDPNVGHLVLWCGGPMNLGGGE